MGPSVRQIESWFVSQYVSIKGVDGKPSEDDRSRVMIPLPIFKRRAIMGISIRHNSVTEAARYLRMRPEQILDMMARGQIGVLGRGGEDFVALDVISEGGGPRRYEPHRPGQAAKSTFPSAPRARSRRRK